MKKGLFSPFFAQCNLCVLLFARLTRTCALLLAVTFPWIGKICYFTRQALSEFLLGTLFTTLRGKVPETVLCQNPMPN